MESNCLPNPYRLELIIDGQASHSPTRQALECCLCALLVGQLALADCSSEWPTKRRPRPIITISIFRILWMGRRLPLLIDNFRADQRTPGFGVRTPKRHIAQATLKQNRLQPIRPPMIVVIVSSLIHMRQSPASSVL